MVMSQSSPFRDYRTERCPKVSVIVSAKNEERYIGTAIESVLAQTYDNLELIIIDDYSDDRTADVARGFRDDRVTVYRKRAEAPGQAASRNIALQIASGSLIAYQDADDHSDPRRLELQINEVLAGDKMRVVGTWIEQRFGSSGRIWKLPTSHEEIVLGFDRLYKRTTIVSGTIVFPRPLALAAPMRTRFKCFEDWDQLCRFSEFECVEFRNVPKVLYVYNIRPKGSKGMHDWSRYNIYERACQARRRAGEIEWSSIEEFEAYLRNSPRAFLRWEVLRYLLELKVNIERIRIARAK